MSAERNVPKWTRVTGPRQEPTPIYDRLVAEWRAGVFQPTRAPLWPSDLTVSGLGGIVPGARRPGGR
ncbi:hypothetical protein ACFV3R_29125 [Streptomyces sp. NPDC059740]|uniref:hypothetical protein n=1 Tax=Streptomyces sp. NPDC059740 TaxID=3346926 RepID=UPI003652784B